MGINFQWHESLYFFEKERKKSGGLGDEANVVQGPFELTEYLQVATSSFYAN